jgi:predicted helicase
MLSLRPHQSRSVEKMQKYNKGIICAVTGAGKTLIGIADTMREFESETPKTVVVVAPRILLAEQLSFEYLEFITNAKVFHCHSGETHWESSTNPKVIQEWVETHKDSHKLIFTTYHSLSRLQESGIKVNTVHLDEAHNSIQKNFFPAVEYFSKTAKRFYSYTATPKNSNSPTRPGMNWGDVYGQIIENVSGPEMVNGGYIVPPKVYAHKSKTTDECGGCPYERDKHNLLDIIGTYKMKKALIVSKKTKDIIGLTTQTDFQHHMKEMGYDVMHISSKYGPIINNKKVNREEFFDTLNAYGKDVDKKFVVLHFDILSEGLNISCLDGVVFQRSTDYTKILQTVGRAVRLDPRDSEGIRSGSITPGSVSDYSKQFGLVITPVFDKVGVSTATKVNNCLDTVFNRGEICVTTVG